MTSEWRAVQQREALVDEISKQGGFAAGRYIEVKVAGNRELVMEKTPSLRGWLGDDKIYCIFLPVGSPLESRCRKLFPEVEIRWI